MNYSIQGNRILFESGDEVAFDFPIVESAVVGKTLVVVLEVPPGTTMIDNAFGVSPNGDILWQVEADETMGGWAPTNVYVGIISSEADAVWLWNYGCYRVKVDVRNGRIITKEFTK